MTSLDSARRLAEKWGAGQIPASPYYYRQARTALRIFGDSLTGEEHSLLVGLVEYYNFHKP
jgi:hypothetical protein